MPNSDTTGLRVDESGKPGSQVTSDKNHHYDSSPQKGLKFNNATAGGDNTGGRPGTASEEESEYSEEEEEEDENKATRLESITDKASKLQLMGNVSEKDPFGLGEYTQEIKN